MSGTQNPQTGGPGGQPGADPSMEDILASIRRILSEDVPQPAAEAPAGGEEPPGDVLVLDPSMMVPEAQPASALPPPELIAEPEPAPVISEAVRELRPRTPQPQPELQIHDEAAEPLVAPEAAAAAAFSVNSLVRRLSAERGTLVRSGGPTIEDMVREELRPMLKQWLDANLPPLVERLVKAEIERVVGRVIP